MRIVHMTHDEEISDVGEVGVGAPFVRRVSQVAAVFTFYNSDFDTSPWEQLRPPTSIDAKDTCVVHS